MKPDIGARHKKTANKKVSEHLTERKRPVWRRDRPELTIEVRKDKNSRKTVR